MRDDFPSVFRQYYSTGEIFDEFYHIKGCINGIYKQFELDGTISVLCNFVDEKIHGKCILYGNKQYIFVNGKIQNEDDDYNKIYRPLIPLEYNSQNNNNFSNSS